MINIYSLNYWNSCIYLQCTSCFGLKTVQPDALCTVGLYCLWDIHSMVIDFIPPPLKITFRRPDLPWDLHPAEVVEDPCRLAPDEVNVTLQLLNNIHSTSLSRLSGPGLIGIEALANSPTLPWGLENIYPPCFTGCQRTVDLWKRLLVVLDHTMSDQNDLLYNT